MMNKKRYHILILPVLSAVACLVATVILLGVFFIIVCNGLPALEWELLTSAMSEAGAAGGLKYQIVGTFILVATALGVAIPIAYSVALMESFLLPRQHLGTRVLGLLMQTMNAVPSIIFGILGLLVFIKFLDWGKSWFAGGFVLGVMIVPTLSIALSERMGSISRHFIEAAAGLGLSRDRIARKVIFPHSLPVLVSGSLLGLARAAGETAPILFVAAIFSGATIPTGIRDNPVLALPYHIFVLAQDSYDPRAREKLWAAALILVLLISIPGLIALLLRRKLHDASHHA